MRKLVIAVIAIAAVSILGMSIVALAQGPIVMVIEPSCPDGTVPLLRASGRFCPGRPPTPIIAPGAYQPKISKDQICRAFPGLQGCGKCVEHGDGTKECLDNGQFTEYGVVQEGGAAETK